MADVPDFSFSEEEIAAIKASMGAVDVDETQDTPTSEVRPKRRGRPPGSKNKPAQPVLEYSTDLGDGSVKLPPAPLTKREEREVAARLANILTGATGMASVMKPYLQMTDVEAAAIAEPLSSYLIRNEPTNGIAREILENYDLLAMTLGVGSYGVRVYHDRKSEVESAKPINTTATERVGSAKTPNNGTGPHEGDSLQVSVSDVTRSGSAPFDI
jgi:hypothetical protein